MNRGAAAAAGRSPGMQQLHGRITKQDGAYRLEHRLERPPAAGAPAAVETTESAAEALALLLARAAEAGAEPVLNDILVANDWRPIETAPHDGTAVLLLLDHEIFIGYFDAGSTREPPGWREQQEGMRAFPAPILWMPLPAKPAAARAKPPARVPGEPPRAAARH